MRKTFMGVQLRRLREERGMTQVALSRTLGLSASYLNQIEQNQRPMTVPVLLKINAELGVDVQRFSDDEEAPRWVYAQGLNLNDPAAPVPIGMGCKVCERADCPQRAFPPMGKAIAVDERRSSFAPYPVVERHGL